MAFTAANSRSFADLSSAGDAKSNTTNTLPPLGRASMGRTWGSMASNGAGNIWASGSRSNGFASTAATRENSETREANGYTTTYRDAESIEGKTGSSSLIEHSVLDERSFPFRNQRDQPSSRSLSTARGSGSTMSQTLNANILDFQGGSGAAPTAGQNTFFSRQTTDFNLNAQHRALVAMPPSTGTYKGYVSERQPTVYTKFDRPTGPSHVPDVTPETWAESAARLSPADTRGSFSSQYGSRGVSVSREHSQPASSHSNDHFSFTSPDYSRATNRTTPNSSRAPSLSSQRNSVYSQYTSQLPENFISEFGQMKVNGEQSRPSTSYRSISSRDGYQSRGSGINPHAPVFGGMGFGSKLLNHNAPENQDETDRAQHPSRNGYSPGRGTLSSNNSAYSMKYLQSPDDFDPRSTADRAHTTSAFRVPDVQPSFGDWQYSNSTQSLFSRRKPSFQDPHGYVDPRHVHQIVAAQMRNDYATAVFNSYGMPGNLPLGGPSYMPFLPMPMSVPDAGTIPRAVASGDGVQSALLYEFKSQTKNQRWELKDIHDHIAEFAGDQHGSRFIQTKLETANSDEKDRVFREIEPNAIQLMTDVFGNYVIQKFFENGDQTHKKTLANKMQGHVLSLSLQMYGCRVVQKALDHVLVDQQASLIKELEGNVIKCVRDQNGNHVIQKAIERCPPQTITFIIAAFHNQVQSLSIHPYGCRVMQRCLEFCDPPSKAVILNELIDGIQNMISDQFGNYVVQHIVTKDDAAGRQRVLDIVIKGLEIYSKHKFASNVVEKCIEEANDRWRREVLSTLTSETHQRTEGESVLVGMLRDGYGNYVIQKLLDTLCTEDYVAFVEALHPAMTQAKRTQNGKQLLSIEKKMHRFQQQLNNGGLSGGTHAGQGPYQMPLPTPPYAGHGTYGSAANTPPPFPSVSQSFNHATTPSGNGDVAGSSTATSRKGSTTGLR